MEKINRHINNILSGAGFDPENVDISLSGFCHDEPGKFDVGLLICTWNRPDYLARTLQSVCASDLDDCLVVVVDDASDEHETAELISQADFAAPTVRLFKKEWTHIHGSIDIGWSLLKGWGCQYLTNLDSDVLVKKDWLTVVRNLYETLDYPRDKMILSGFNRHNNPCILSDYDDHFVKSRMGAVNYYFDVSVFDTVKEFLTHRDWDSALQDHFMRNKFLGFVFVATKPSVVQHIGKQGINSEGGRHDYAVDFDQETNSARKFVGVQIDIENPEFLPTLLCAWLYARSTGRFMIINGLHSGISESLDSMLQGAKLKPAFRIDEVDVYLGKFAADQSKNPNLLDLVRFSLERDEGIVNFSSAVIWPEVMHTHISDRFFECLRSTNLFDNKDLDKFHIHDERHKKYSCLITFRDDGKNRLRNLYYVLDHLCADPEFEVIIVEQDVSPIVDDSKLPPGSIYKFVFNPGLFNKSWGLNIAANLSHGEILIVHDADMVCEIEALRHTADQVGPQIDAANPYDMLIDLSQRETDLLLQGDPSLDIQRTSNEINRLYAGESPPFCGGIFIIRRDFFYSIGGMDERFRGWGGEDDEISIRIRANTTKIRSTLNQIAYHLWHPRMTDSVSRDPSPYFRNLCYRGVRTELGHDLYELTRFDVDHNGDPERYQPQNSPKDIELSLPELPLVSCLCVTRDRLTSLKRAIHCFLEQTYPNRELLIICDEDDSQTVKFVKSIHHTQIRYHIVPENQSENLGQLRNLSIEKSKGEYFCQWDDDDWYSPQRISVQLAAAIRNGKSASLLPRWYIYAAKKKKLVLSNIRFWEGSILCKRDIGIDTRLYLEVSRGEEEDLIRYLVVKDDIAIEDNPELYVYCYSGNNTWDEQHFNKILSRSQAVDEDTKIRIKEKILFDSSNDHGKPFEIPRIIHQTARKEKLSERLAHLQQKVTSLHPEWQYKFYDNAACRKFIEDHAPLLLSCYDQLPRDIQRADLFRYIVVYIEGGFYIDTDMDIQRPLDSLCMHDCVLAQEKLLSENDEGYGVQDRLRVANYMFGAKPYDPFIAKIIVEIANNTSQTTITAENDILETTGPGMLTRLYHDYEYAADITLLENKQYICSTCQTNSCSFGEYAYHLHLGSWRWENSTFAGISSKGEPVRIIHQTWKTDQIPEALERFSQSWKIQHPDWQYCLWTDEDNRNLIATHYAWFLETYDSFPYAIQRADAARYFILYTVGGLYVDLDFHCLRSIEPLIDNAPLLLGLENERHHEFHKQSRMIGNAIIYADAPGNLFLREVIEELCQSTEVNENEDDYVLQTTGPKMFSRAYENYLNKDEINLLPAEKLYPIDYLKAENLLANPDANHRFIENSDAYAVHYHVGSWWKSSEE